MTIHAPPSTEQLVHVLRHLCRRPSTTGQADELRAAAEHTALFVRLLGMQVRIVATSAAPVIIAHRSGRRRQTLLLYHHYDAPPTGPWRHWSHEPFDIAERDGQVFGRGVAGGKGALAAHLAALQAIVQREGELPCGITLVIEGAAIIGSPGLAEALQAHADLLQCDAVLASLGDRDAQGTPICASGSKGWLRLRLTAHGPAYPLPAGFATSVANPLWRLIWALAALKGDDEDVRIEGFYDAVEGPSRTDNAAIRQLQLATAARRQAWQIEQFLFGIDGAALSRTEVTLPTCNVSALTVEPSGDTPAIPALASALLDIQLVPGQQPAAIYDLVQRHLNDKGFADVALERLPGGYPPWITATDHPVVSRVATIGATVFERPLPVVPAGPYVAPLSLLTGGQPIPTLSIGFTPATSAIFAPNEHIALADLSRHSQLLIELLDRLWE
ncbi:MAG: M20/M25/M40 family metallo-hydrolase [Chloroflexus sp.]|nr:M20/M25/M40 family metallo-hydrolase [Chloroflexus sp.]